MGKSVAVPHEPLMLSEWKPVQCLETHWHFYLVNDKIDFLLLLRPDSESFGKWCLEKLANFFHFDCSYACHQHPKILVHNAPMWHGVKNKNQFFPIFSLQTINCFFKSLIYIKNVFFWGIWPWCTSDGKQLERGLILKKMAILAPLPFAQFLSCNNIS